MKVQKTIQRGTAKTEAEFSPLNWAGNSYKKFQTEKMDKVSGDTIMVSARGHQAVRLDQRAKPQVSDVTTEVTLVTGRGTGTRKIKIINN